MKVKSIIFQYLAKSFLKSFLIVILCFFFIIAILESMEIIRRYFSNSIDISYVIALKLIIYHTIVSIFSLFSFVAFLAIILFFTIMHSKLELTVMRILGISTLDIIKSLSSAVLLLGIFYITVLDRISAFSSENISSIDADLKQNSRKKDNNFLTVTNNGIWFRDIYKQNSYTMYAKSLNTKSQSLCDVRFFEFDENNELKLSVYSKTATISNGQWILYNANVTDIYNDVERTSIQISFPTHLRFSYINKMVKHPTKISFWSLRKYVAIIEKAGLSSTKYITNWFSRLSIPFQMFAFTILVTTLCIDYNARNPKKYAIKTAILLTTFFPVYLFNNILTTLAENSDVPINIFSFIIPIFITSVSCILLNFARRK